MGAAIGQRDEATIGEMHDKEAVVSTRREIGRRADREGVDRTLPMPVATLEGRAATIDIGPMDSANDARAR